VNSTYDDTIVLVKCASTMNLPQQLLDGLTVLVTYCTCSLILLLSAQETVVILFVGVVWRNS